MFYLNNLNRFMTKSKLLLPLLSILFLNCNQNNMLQLDFVNKTYDFKYSKQGEIITAKFEYKNTSRDTITIENISVECDCISLNNRIPQKISPQSTDSIIVGFNTKATHLGKQIKNITLRTNGNPRIYSLKIIGEIIPK